MHSNQAFLLMKHDILTPHLSLCCCGRILNTTLFESWEIVGPYPSWWVFNLLLILLQLLHSFWSYLIVKTVCRAISKGKVSHHSQNSPLYSKLRKRVFCCQYISQYCGVLIEAIFHFPFLSCMLTCNLQGGKMESITCK